jgi:hypothetical protein
MGSTPSNPGYLPNTPSNDSENQQLQDIGIGPNGGDMPSPSPSPDSSPQASSDNSSDNVATADSGDGDSGDSDSGDSDSGD